LVWKWRSWLIRLPVGLFLSAKCLCVLTLAIFGEWPWRSWHDEVPLELHLVTWFTLLFLLPLAVAHRVMRRASSFYAGRMIVVPNHHIDIYSRLWCVYEVFTAKRLGIGVEMAPTLASAGAASSQLAECGCPEDDVRIRAEIEESSFGYDAIDRAVQHTLRGDARHNIGVWIKYVILQAVPVVSSELLKSRSQIHILLFVLCIFYGVFTAWIHYFASRQRGVLEISNRGLKGLAIVALACSVWRECYGYYLGGRGHWWWDLLDVVGYDAALCALIPITAIIFRKPLVRFGAACRCPMLFMYLCLDFIAIVTTPKCPHGYDVKGILSVQNFTMALLDSWSGVAPIYMLCTEIAHVGMKFRHRELECSRSLCILGCFAILSWFLVMIRIRSHLLGCNHGPE